MPFRSFLPKATTFFLSLTLILPAFPFGLKVAVAEESASHTLGDIIASGKVRMKLETGQWLNIDSTSMPLFDGSKIRIEEGTAAITLRDNGLIEVLSNSDIHISKKGGVFLELSKGTIKFSLPSGANISMHTPIATIKAGNTETTSNRVIPVNSRETVGVIKVAEDGTTSVISLRGPLKVITVDKKSQFVKEGEAIQVAKLDVGNSAGRGDSSDILTTTNLLGTVLAVGILATVIISLKDASPSN